MKRALTIIALGLSLQGCFFAVGAAAGAVAVAVVYDHRKVDQVVIDQRITNLAYDKIRYAGAKKEDARVDVTCFNQIVLLTGDVPTDELKQSIDAGVKSIPNVKTVHNQIRVGGLTSQMTRASDSIITARIKTEMLGMKGLKSGSIKVVTEDGTVYLMGVVNEDQAYNAVEIARQVSGVQKVVKIFQIVNTPDEKN